MTVDKFSLHYNIRPQSKHLVKPYSITAKRVLHCVYIFNYRRTHFCVSNLTFITVLKHVHFVCWGVSAAGGDGTVFYKLPAIQFMYLYKESVKFSCSCVCFHIKMEQSESS